MLISGNLYIGKKVSLPLCCVHSIGMGIQCAYSQAVPEETEEYHTIIKNDERAKGKMSKMLLVYTQPQCTR